MKLLPGTRGQFAMLDDDDFPRFAIFGWQAHFSVKGNTYYFSRKLNHLPGRPAVWLHREILGLGRLKEDPRQVDHRDHNGLNCQRYNIRIATWFQNAANKRLRSDNASGYKGVYYHRANDKWVAQITANGKQMYLGIFDNPDAAHAVYCEAARIHHAEFACIP